MKYVFLINSFTVKSQVDKIKNNIKNYCLDKLIDYVIEVNSDDYSTEDILKKYVSGKYMIVAIGGDGLINRILKYMINSNNILSIVPCGSGNDFYRVIEKNTVINCDCLKINDQYFINTACFGIDADVANNKDTIKIKYLPKKQCYNIALVKTFFKYRPKHMKVSINNVVYEFDFTTVVVCNGGFYGGGYNINPASSINDGCIEVYLVKNVHKIKMLYLILKMKKGKHINLKDVVKLTGERVEIDAKNEITANIDGEKKVANHFNIELLKNSIQLYVNEEMNKKILD